MNFRSYADLSKDVARFCMTLPPVDAVYGIPHTGTVVAVMVSDILHIPMVHLEQGRPVFDKEEKPLGTLLVIDDSILRGTTMAEAVKGIDTDATIITAAVYYKDVQCDCVYKRLGSPRFFEWNIFAHKYRLKDAAIDIDGVLCPDPDVDEYTKQKEYEQYLMDAPLFYRPIYPVKKVVTSRMERYRKITKDWLKRNGIVYGELCMSVRTNAKDRKGKHAQDKARHLKGVKLMIESDKKQAEYIGKYVPCLCIGNMRLYGGNKSLRDMEEVL